MISEYHSKTLLSLVLHKNRDLFTRCSNNKTNNNTNKGHAFFSLPLPYPSYTLRNQCYPHDKIEKGQALVFPRMDDHKNASWHPSEAVFQLHQYQPFSHFSRGALCWQHIFVRSFFTKTLNSRYLSKSSRFLTSTSAPGSGLYHILILVESWIVYDQCKTPWYRIHFINLDLTFKVSLHSLLNPQKEHFCWRDIDKVSLNSISRHPPTNPPDHKSRERELSLNSIQCWMIYLGLR